MMIFAGHDAGPGGTPIENDFLSTLSVMRSRHLVEKSNTEEIGVSQDLHSTCVRIIECNALGDDCGSFRKCRLRSGSLHS